MPARCPHTVPSPPEGEGLRERSERGVRGALSSHASCVKSPHESRTTPHCSPLSPRGGEGGHERSECRVRGSPAKREQLPPHLEPRPSGGIAAIPDSYSLSESPQQSPRKPSAPKPRAQRVVKRQSRHSCPPFVPSASKRLRQTRAASALPHHRIMERKETADKPTLRRSGFPC